MQSLLRASYEAVKPGSVAWSETNPIPSTPPGPPQVTSDETVVQPEG